MITKMKTTKHIPAIMRLAEEKIPGATALLEYQLYRSIGSLTDLVLLDVRDEKLFGFLLAVVSYTSEGPQVSINSCVSNKGSLMANRGALGMVDSWAQRLGISRMRAITTRNPGAFEKRYGFSLKSYVIVRDIPQEP